MTDKKFPPEFMAHFKNPNTRAAWVSEYSGPNMTHCENCGGAGTFVLTVALNGPFDQPPPPTVVSKYDNGRWWAVKNYVAVCPVCRNVRPQHKPVYVPMPEEARHAVNKLIANKSRFKLRGAE